MAYNYWTYKFNFKEERNRNTPSYVGIHWILSSNPGKERIEASSCFSPKICFCPILHCVPHPSIGFKQLTMRSAPSFSSKFSNIIPAKFLSEMSINNLISMNILFRKIDFLLLTLQVLQTQDKIQIPSCKNSSKF